MKKFAAAALVSSVAVVSASRARAASPEKIETTSGIVTLYSGAKSSFTIETENRAAVKFRWTRDTKFNGVVERGARVSVRYTSLADGQNEARTVAVLR